MANVLVRDYINALSKYAMPNVEQAAAMGRHFVDLLAIALNQTSEQFEAGEKGVRAVLAAAIEREIEAHFLNQEFSPTHAAANLRITTRYLHKILEPTGMSFSERVMQRRLHHARELLSSSWPTQGILSVALDSGFRNAEHFSQRFRAAFGVTPREFRNACQPK
jgi:AraC-like DNA-binding protein